MSYWPNLTMWQAFCPTTRSPSLSGRSRVSSNSSWTDSITFTATKSSTETWRRQMCSLQGRSPMRCAVLKFKVCIVLWVWEEWFFILFYRKGILKLADFGLARAFSYNPDKPNRYTNRVVTLWYRYGHKSNFKKKMRTFVLNWFSYLLNLLWYTDHRNSCWASGTTARPWTCGGRAASWQKCGPDPPSCRATLNNTNSHSSLRSGHLLSRA